MLNRIIIIYTLRNLLILERGYSTVSTNFGGFASLEMAGQPKRDRERGN
jgi:hypothetical protein